MKKAAARKVLLILFAIFGFMIPSYSANLKLEITASLLKDSNIRNLNVDFKLSSATEILLKPFSYGLIQTSGWLVSALALEPNNTLHFCVDEKGVLYPNNLMYLRVKKAKELPIYSDPKLNLPQNLKIPLSPDKRGKRFFRFCLVNVKNEGYVVSNLFSFQLNSDYEICDAKNITWSEMPKVAQKSLEELIIKKAEELKETFTPEMIINQINQW